MRFENVETGMKVIIDKECISTARKFGINHNMESMRGHTFSVERIISSDIIVIQGWNWHANDLSPYKFEYEEFNAKLNQKPELFNPDNLEL